MKKEETLRGRGAFSLLYDGGRKFEGSLLRCFFRIDAGAGTPLRAGFSISSRTFNAVRRNRIRRLMRAAFDYEGRVLRDAARGMNLVVLFVYKGRKGVSHDRLTLQEMRSDMESICRRCAAMIAPVPQ